MIFRAARNNNIIIQKLSVIPIINKITDAIKLWFFYDTFEIEENTKFCMQLVK